MLLKKSIIKLLFLCILLHIDLVYAQEWKNLKQYKKDTGNSILCDGSWLIKDRKKKTEVWHLANQYNLKAIKGSEKYISIGQKRDFYLWFDQERKRKHHEIKWIAIASVAANQLSKVEVKFIRIFIVRNKEVVLFLEKGSNNVFDFAFPHLKDVYFSSDILKGEEAVNWDRKYGIEEQCQILEPLYKKLSAKAIKRLERMAKGKGVFSLNVPEQIKFEGEITDCEHRFKHGTNKLFPYYSSN